MGLESPTVGAQFMEPSATQTSRTRCLIAAALSEQPCPRFDQVNARAQHMRAKDETERRCLNIGICKRNVSLADLGESNLHLEATSVQKRTQV